MSIFDRSQTCEIASTENWKIYRGSEVIKKNQSIEVWRKLRRIIKQKLFTQIIWEKLLDQSKEIKQKWKGLKNFDICSCVIFNCQDQSFVSEKETGY